jgi:SAM domain (Sterile alpha motif)
MRGEIAPGLSSKIASGSGAAKPGTRTTVHRLTGGAERVITRASRRGQTADAFGCHAAGSDPYPAQVETGKAVDRRPNTAHNSAVEFAGGAPEGEHVRYAAGLQAQGFGQYAEALPTNAIDAEALLELTDEHLKELGLPLGHRVKLLKAIRELRGPEAAPAVDRPTPSAGRAPAAERPQLTVMFVDLVGSTAWRRGWAAARVGRSLRAPAGVCNARWCAIG